MPQLLNNTPQFVTTASIHLLGRRLSHSCMGVAQKALLICVHMLMSVDTGSGADGALQPLGLNLS